MKNPSFSKDAYAKLSEQGALAGIPRKYTLDDIRYLSENQMQKQEHGVIYFGLNNGYIQNYPAYTSWIGSSPLVAMKADVAENISKFTQVSTLNTSTVTSAPYTQAYIDKNGKLFTWGPNNSNSLFGRSTANYSIPTQVGTDSWQKFIPYTNSTTLTQTTLITCIGLRADGTLWSSGSNAYGQAARGTVSTVAFGQCGTDSDWVDVFAGTYNVFAIKSNGTLWSAGQGTNYLTDQGNTSTYSSLTQVGTGTDWLNCEIEIGPTTAYIVKSNGTLWSVGQNTNGLTGLGFNTGTTTTLTQVGTDTDWIKVRRGGSSNVYGIKTDGSLWGWGVASGLHSYSSHQYAPVELVNSLVSNTQFVDIICPTQASCLLKTLDGRLAYYSPFAGISFNSKVNEYYVFDDIPPNFKMYLTALNQVTILW